MVSYDDLVELVGTPARRVEAIMASAGLGVPWWRVVDASGHLPGHLVTETSRHWADEEIPAVDGQCVISQARADLPRLVADHKAWLVEWAGPARDLTSSAVQ